MPRAMNSMGRVCITAVALSLLAATCADDSDNSGAEDLPSTTEADPEPTTTEAAEPATETDEELGSETVEPNDAVEDGTFGPRIAANDFLAPGLGAAMHNDSGSSDVTDLPGPGTGEVDIAAIALDAVCPAILIGSDDYPVALCTSLEAGNIGPKVYLLDPDDGSPLADLPLERGNIFAGVYGYLDEADQMVMVDGSNDLLRIAHEREGSDWTLEIVQRTPLDDVLIDGDSVTSLAPGYDGNVWFATDAATVGYADTTNGMVKTLVVGEGERAANSISTAPEGTAVATNHALYLIDADDDGELQVRWRLPYERGPARKPGQLSWGTGSSPTFFGPTTGSDYLAIVDNADPEVHLLVVPTTGDDAGQPICAPVVLSEGGPGSENSPIGAGNTVIVASTYGHENPAVPAEAGPAVPESAPFEGGMTRVDIRPDGSGCDLVWESSVRSAAVPKMSTADETIVTMERVTPEGATGRVDDTFSYAVISVDTGEVLASHPLGPEADDPLQLGGNTGPGRVLYQGTFGTIMRIAAAAADG